MPVVSSECFIKCCSESGISNSADLPSGKLKVFYGITKKLSSKQMELVNYLTSDEKSRAEKFLFTEDRNTYICCHGLLRLILSREMKIDPLDIFIINDDNNKPGISGDPLYFNITHVRDAFAIVLSEYYYVGIDIENSDQNIDFSTLINSYFGKMERKFILDSETDSKNRFFLLWTRKEAFLKAIGTGIVENLNQIELSGSYNKIDIKPYENLVRHSIYDEHFIYSIKVNNFILSIAVPQKSKIIIQQINERTIEKYLK